MTITEAKIIKRLGVGGIAPSPRNILKVKDTVELNWDYRSDYGSPDDFLDDCIEEALNDS